MPPLPTLVLAGCFLLSWSLPRHSSGFHFTRTFYNVTIPENSVSRTLATGGERMGVPRLSWEDDVTFRVVTGDPDRIFKVEAKSVGDFIFLVLRTRGGNSVVLNRERKDKFVLTVKAFSTRTSVEATTIIYVRVLDQNDLSPIFFPSSYNATLPEDFGLHGSVLKVAAEDADLGVNGEVFYWIKEQTEYFAIHPSTGVVTLTKPLKYAERSVHDLTIVAQDRATIFRGGGQSSEARAMVRVQQVNLYGPEIYVYVLQDPSAHRLGLVYAVVRVVDRDEGIHGQIGDVRIVNGDDAGVFIIHPVDESKQNSKTEFNIILSNDSRLEKDVVIFNLSLQVKDRGFPQRKSYKAVSIKVSQGTDFEPYFEQESYEINVPEYLPQGSPLLRLGIVNRGMVLGNELVFKFTEGNFNSDFIIDSKTFTLCTNLPLDAEKQRTYSLVVSVRKGDNILFKQASTTKIKVNVIDSNDNNPEFNDIPDHVFVSENQPAGTHVVKITASDPDLGGNGEITYSIANLRTVPFEIDPFSGVLRTTQPLDYERMRRYYILRVRTSDSGVPFRRESEALVKVQTKNVNDNRPVFVRGECSLSMPKNIKVGSDLFSISATDLDETDVITYRLTTTYRGDCIKIDASTGLLSVHCDFSELSESEWGLNITATDGLHKVETSVRVFVASSELAPSEIGRVQYSCRDLDTFKDDPTTEFTVGSPSQASDNLEFEMMLTGQSDNVNDPLIIGLPMCIKINNTLPLDSEIITITAVDKDGGFNGKLIYKMTCEPESFVFKINPDDGKVILFNHLNFTESNLYSVNVTVCDLGSPARCTSGITKIEIIDVISKVLSFKNISRKIHVSEAAAVGTELIRLETSDNDYSHPVNISYSLISGDGHFGVDSKTGSIVLREPLDRELMEIHTVTVRASNDHLSDRAVHSDITVTVYVDDVNDNAPQFVNTRLEVEAREDLPRGSVVYDVNAVDVDLCLGGEIVYSLLGTELFTIDSTTGTVRLNGRLDFESDSEHRVAVQATDKGTPALSALTCLVIKVVDVNENLHPPVFDEVVTSMSVKENLPPGTLVGTVSATDADPAGVDSKISYGLLDGDGLSFFTVTKQGQVLTTAILDAEAADHYWLTVVAEDTSSVPLSASIQVYISVQDDNDRLPMTVEPFYHLSIEENLPSHTPLGHVTSFGDVTYSLSTHSASKVPFSIDRSSGLISTTTLLDREEVEEYILQVVVIGGGGGESMSSTTTVFLSVVDVNDHSPQFTRQHYITRLPHTPQHTLEALSVGGGQREVSTDGLKWVSSRWFVTENSPAPVFQVLAVDLDAGENGTVRYSLEGGTHFVIHEDTGNLYAQKKLDPDSQYELWVRASDQGRPSRSSRARVTVVTPPHRPAPRRAAPQHTEAVVSEGLPPGAVVLKLNTSLQEHSPVSYVITGGTGVHYFAIQDDVILVGRRLDCEGVDGDQLTAFVRATSITHTWDIKVTLRIEDVNEFHPRFSQTIYSLNISEATPPGSVIGSLLASDRDLRSSLSYAVHNHQPGSGMFTMDPATGELILTEPVDREMQTFHELTVAVSDGGVPPHWGYAQVHVTVEDVNDEIPVWPEGRSLELRVREASLPRSTVARLVASDRDSGENGTVEYTIISGNKNSTFKLHPESGVLQLAKALYWLDTPDFMLTVRAMDHGTPRLESRAIVRVIVVPSEKRTPVCVDSEAWVEVTEDIPVGSVVGSVRAKGAPSLVYELTAELKSAQGLFKVGYSSGDITLKQPLDYESNQVHNLTVNVMTLAGVKVECGITIFVLDQNDNPPSLSETSYSGHVLESAPAGTMVMTDQGPLRILAEDMDSGANGLLEFKLHGCSGECVLNVNPITGIVRTARPLDYERVPVITLLVSVHDMGLPPLQSDTRAFLRVTVMDVNDCPPHFSQPVYNATVLLPTDRDVLVTQVTAMDPDSPAITTLSFSIISGNADQALVMDDTGSIYVHNPDHLGRHPRQLIVQVSDGIRLANASVNIHLESRGQSALRFQRTMYHAAVLENTTTLTTVAAVSVLGARLAEDIRYSILNRSPMFTIASTSGVVFTNGHVFDRESKDCYRLIVQAVSAERGLVALTSVNVTVLDINDNCPQFLNLPYRATLSANATKGDFVYKVTAKDLDTGDNGEVRYELDQSGSELFRIGRRSGEIRLKGLSVLNKREVHVKVFANDGGMVPCSTVTTISVSVVHPGAPVWDRTVYKAQVPESVPLLSSVSISLHASSSSPVVYQLVQDSGHFLIRHDTALLQVYSALDREATSLHSLNVRATDSVSRLASDTLVLVEVTDDNDCHPRFLQDNHELKVGEGVLLGTILGVVEAVDCDEGPNAVVRYSLVDSHFQVDPVYGTLILKQPLDFERSKRHQLTITATDSGAPALSAYITVWVQVINENDNAPQLTAPVQRLLVSRAAARGGFVGKVTARDEDGDRLTYRILSVEENIRRTFTLNNETGIITVANPKFLLRENNFTLKISVDDGLHSASGIVQIRVLPSNNHPPVFDREVYQAAVLENLPAQRVIRVVATDKDTGAFGNVEYNMPLQTSSALFSVDNRTGDIKTLKPLDRESADSHELLVSASDGGELRSWATVLVRVIDVNDNPPQFELPQYFGCVLTNVSTEQEVVKVTAVDPDDRSNSGKVQYSIVEAQPHYARDWFTISIDGIVSTTNYLNVEPQIVTLTLRAADGGAPPHHADVTLRLTLVSRDRPLLPSPLRYLPSPIIVPSTAKPGFVVYDTKMTIPEKQKFRILSQNGFLKMNSIGQLILVKKPLFPEEKMGIYVESTTICAFKQTTLRTLNEPEAPSCIEENVKLTIPENIAVGTSIYKVFTKHDNSNLFSIYPKSSTLFSLDPLTGWLTVSKTLDRESITDHVVIILATDSSTSLTSNCSVFVHITDCNDNPHIFNKEVYNIAVKEDAPTGTSLIRFTMTDPDELHDVMEVYVTDGDVTSSFGVSPELELMVTHPLDREHTPSYALTVVATDGLFTATARVNVVVIDVNDERHLCLHALYEARVSEGRPPGHLVTSVLTSDPDLETSFVYGLSGLGADRFTIDLHGEVRLREYLDRETTGDYLLEVSVSDSIHTDWTCRSRIRITVEDINDNPPTFVVANETITLTEDAAVGMIVTKVEVLDFDEGDNRRIRYSLEGQGLFSLSADSGLLTLARPLQSSPGSVHSAIVRVTDRGRPSLSSTSTLQLVVLGMSDDPPAPVTAAFHVSVPEDAPPGTSLVHVKVFTEDVFTKGSVIYNILEGNNYGEFEIDKKTGLLSTCKTLDHETRSSYNLLVLAAALGDTSLAAYCSVNVTVLDINDNPPLFKVNRYSVSVQEDVEVGQIILRVEAEDSDSGRNGFVMFSLDKHSSKSFSVDPLSGVLAVSTPLDREQIAQHTVLIQAADHGDPPLTSTATVIIDLTDVNDNPPVFTHPNSTAILQADRMPGWAVFHFAVTDADQPSATSAFSFQLTSGNERGMFRVDADGTLRTTDRLSLQLGEGFTCRVRVDDGGTPNLHSSTWIYIKVVEPSKHPPVLQPLSVWVGVYEDQWRGGDLGHVTAIDLDPYDRLEYSVLTPQFTVDPRHGLIKARTSLAPGVHEVNVTVSDGRFSSTASITITVETLSQDMLQTSVYIRLAPRTSYDALVSKLPQFLTTLRSAFLRDVSLISIQETDSTIGLLIAVAGGADLHVVREVLTSAGLSGTTPQCDCRNGGVCQRQLMMMPDRTNVFSASGLSFVTPGHSLTLYCICSIGYAGQHCEEVKCLCPPLQVCVPQRVGFSCMPPCSANQTCPAAMTSSVTWSDLATTLLSVAALVVAVVAFVLYRKYKSTSNGERKYGSWGKHNSYIKRKTKLSNLEASQKPPIFTGSPNNGRTNLEAAPGLVGEGEALPLDYLRNINPVTSKMENDILHGHSSAPDLATCHATDSFVQEDPARQLAALDDQLSQEVVQYGFPAPTVTSNPLAQEMEVPL